MKIAILETAHFQYAQTQSEIFSDCQKIFITTEAIKNNMEDYALELRGEKYYIIKSIADNEKEILNIINNEKIDLLLISPVFNSYSALKRIVKKIKCKKIITTHNINTWFHHRFWSPNSFMDRINMKSILNNCDYIAVEDFIYNHLKSTNDLLYQKYKFLYIPFTIFHENKIRKYFKTENILKVVLTGSINGDRRRYEEVLEVIKYFNNGTDKITFSFAGKAMGEYGKKIVNQLKELKKVNHNIVSFFDEKATADMFKKEMEMSDLVLSVSTKTFKGMGTLEYIGKTKPTAAIHDMMTYELPGLLPVHLVVPNNLKGSVFNYISSEELISILNNLLEHPEVLKNWKEKAKQNSLNFTASQIRRGMPF